MKSKIVNNDNIPIELTYEQIRERAKLLCKDYMNYKVCMNIKSHYAPEDVCGVSFFIIDGQEKMCFIKPRKMRYMR